MLYNKITPPHWQSGTQTIPDIIPSPGGWVWRHDKGNGRFWDEIIVAFSGIHTSENGSGGSPTGLLLTLTKP